MLLFVVSPQNRSRYDRYDRYFIITRHHISQTSCGQTSFTESNSVLRYVYSLFDLLSFLFIIPSNFTLIQNEHCKSSPKLFNSSPTTITTPRSTTWSLTSAQMSRLVSSAACSADSLTRSCLLTLLDPAPCWGLHSASTSIHPFS